MRSNLIGRFHFFVGLLFLVMSAMHLFGNQGSMVVQPLDPLFGISVRYIFWLFASAGLFVSFTCLFNKLPEFCNVLIVWLTSYLLLYRIFLFTFDVKLLDGFYSSIAFNFGIPAHTISFLTSFLIFAVWLLSVCSQIFLKKGVKKA